MEKRGKGKKGKEEEAMRIDWVEGFGFALEVLSFVMAGFFIWINIYLSVLFYVLGLVMAYLVGKRIREKARQLRQ